MGWHSVLLTDNGVKCVAEQQESTTIVHVPLEQIQISPYQPRKRFGQAELEELAASIREHGVLQPLVVRPIAAGQYELIAGERRLRASKLAGLPTVPAIVKDLDDHQAAVITLIENLQREDLHFLEVAEGYQMLIEQFNLTQEELARQVGKSQSAIANKLRLLRLPDTIRQYIPRVIIGERHARALLRLNNSEDQMKVLEEIVKRGLTVKQTEQLVEKYLQSNDDRTKTGQKMLRIFKDIRIFLNTFRQAVDTLRNAGVAVEFDESRDDQFIEVRVRIPLH